MANGSHQDGPDHSEQDSKTPAEGSDLRGPNKGISRRDFMTASVAATAMASPFGRAALAATPDDQSVSPNETGLSAEIAASADSVYRIHPAIGIARVGNADPDSFFIGPEIPGQPAMGDTPGTMVPPFKDVDGLMKPQAARFRIFEYLRGEGDILTPIREVNLSTPGIKDIRWEVHLANKKASFHRFRGQSGETEPPADLRNAAVTNETERKSLEIDFGARSVNGASQGPVPFSVGTSADPDSETYPVRSDNTPVIERLGELRTDDEGRLIVIGGSGIADYYTDDNPGLPSYANNDGWFDDISDGPVTATVILEDGSEIRVDAAGRAWVLVAPPDFAPQIGAAVSLYDLLYDLAVRKIPIPNDNALYFGDGPLARLTFLKDAYDPGGLVEFPGVVADFQSEILPTLKAAFEYRWVTALVSKKHNSLTNPNLADPNPAYASERTRIFGYTRPPEGSPKSSGAGTMPKLLGDDPYSGQAPNYVRHLALTTMKYGLLRNWSEGLFDSVTIPPITEITPHGLDRAALENASGGAFYPGIEVGWQIRNPVLFIEPFRIDHDAMSGHWGEENQPIGPGHFSRQMALPWHADFNDCQSEGRYGWWPSQRPDNVYLSPNDTKMAIWARPDRSFDSGSRTSNHEDMVALWYKFGIVTKQGDAFVEAERAPTIP